MTIRITKLVSVGIITLGCVLGPLAARADEAAVAATYADIEPARRDFGFEPRTRIEVGVPRFVTWYREYHGA